MKKTKKEQLIELIILALLGAVLGFMFIWWATAKENWYAGSPAYQEQQVNN